MKRMTQTLITLLAGAVLIHPPLTMAQAPVPRDKNAPAPADKNASPPPAPPALEPPEPAYDPLRASKNIEVGKYYEKAGNYDAAINRFKDAAAAQPGLAEPYRLLGATYEKKHDPKDAVASYEKYLQIYRTAPDSQAISKRVEKLRAEMDRQKKH
jgi:tetratricopeptide (TPR) repeat protein